ncbi:putative E3 Ubiquitin-Protein Ligase Herc1 [Manis pentadactyla]|nr:putative E3 Ubiquitin-Protein Ligase Herc1 [Manis pentadactyla]
MERLSAAEVEGTERYTRSPSLAFVPQWFGGVRGSGKPGVLLGMNSQSSQATGKTKAPPEAPLAMFLRLPPLATSASLEPSTGYHRAALVTVLLPLSTD